MSNTRTHSKSEEGHTRRPALKLDKFVKNSKLSKFDHHASKKQRLDKKARLLRGYTKALKREGFDTSINTRKRQRKTENDDDEGRQLSSLIREEDSQIDQGNKKFKKRFKSDPFFKAKKKAEEKRREKEEKRATYEKNMQEKEKKIRLHKRKAKHMMRRTKKGQPVMKNVITNMLEKLKAEKDRDSRQENSCNL